MRKTIATLFLSASFVGLPVMVGCDRTVSKEETVTKKADGSVETKKEEHKVNP